MITAAATATANRIPLLLLPGDVFATRQPDPVLQQIEQSYDLSISTNDAFRAVSKYWDRITRPEQLMSACINAMRVLTDPAETGAVTLCLPQDVQGEAWDYPESFFARRVHRLDRRPASAAQLADAVAAIKASRKPLIVCGGGVKYSGAGEALSRLPSATACRSPKPRPGKGRWSLPSAERRRRRRNRLPGGEPAGERGRLGDRYRHPFQRFHHLLKMDFPAPGRALPEY
jgi:3D-(3,5/4)-trihydroxycyclohexane-1,2-dione acylhydrolase (decyclizing)